MSDGHQCPAPGCEELVPSTEFACRPHWFSIPKELRAALWQAYEVNGPLSEEHIAAMEECTAFLEGRHESQQEPPPA